MKNIEILNKTNFKYTNDWDVAEVATLLLIPAANVASLKSKMNYVVQQYNKLKKRRGPEIWRRGWRQRCTMGTFNSLVLQA